MRLYELFSRWPAPVRLAVLALIWVAAWVSNEQIWRQLGRYFVTDPTALPWSVIEFFIYDSLKILLLLSGMIFVIALVRTTVRPESVRDYLAGKPLIFGLAAAAIFGAVTPFCSCSSIPLFIGFVSAGIPISVTITFLIASPLVNEVAVVLLGATFGWGFTSAYIGTGLTLAVTIGAILSRFDFSADVADFVYQTRAATSVQAGTRPTLEQRLVIAAEETREIFGRVWKWVFIGVGFGAIIHGWVPTDFFERYAGPGNPFAVVVATLVGVPLYANAAGVIPIAAALAAKGVSLGTVMSFMMATVALSLPEFVLLKQVLKPRLLAVFFGSVTAAIMVIGFLFNLAYGVGG